MSKKTKRISQQTPHLASRLLRHIAFIIHAHTFGAKKPSDTVRRFDLKTPYAVHPVWCAMTILQEPGLLPAVRYRGATVLLFHDVLEDTNAELPKDLTRRERKLIEGMTFESLDDEMATIWRREEEIWLWKLYDKVSNYQDGTWMSPERRKQLRDYLLELTNAVEEKWGTLNIVLYARAFISRNA
ncbi:hypothetical protein H7X87_03650 [Acetobacteraceae bacterium]|nr:hypothetical protein [Candidatus Parcubacteria bacterium]